MTTAAATPAAPAAAAAETPAAGQPAAATATVPTPAAGDAAPPKSISKEFTVLARREQQLQRQREAQKAKDSEIAQREAAIARREAELEQRYAKPKSPREALERFGWDLKTANELELNDGNPTPEMIAREAKEETAALRKQIEEEKRQASEAEKERLKTAEAAALDAFKKQCRDFVEGKAEDYELIQLYESQDLVFDTIDEHFTKTGKILDLKEAADLVESYLADQVAKAKATRKFQAQQGSPQPAKDGGNPSKPDSSGQVSAQRRTLSSDLTSSTPTLVHSSPVQEDALMRALRKLEGG